MTHTKRVLAIHDLCAFGRCSLTAAVPVISAMGIQVCPFPTALFSNNFTYGSFVFSDFTEKMQGFMRQWESLGLHYDAVYSGFLASAEQIAVVEEAIDCFARRAGHSLVVVDPAMGDDGKLYPTFTPEMVKRMKRLAKKADLITPNYTEACLLLGRGFSAEAPSSDGLEAMCRSLAAGGASQVVVTSVPKSEDEIGVVSFDRETGAFTEMSTARLPLSTCGTGDIFTSVVTGALLRGGALHEAVRLAMDFVSAAIERTLQEGADSRAGVIIEPCLPRLMS